jgi:hypothetical protein
MLDQTALNNANKRPVGNVWLGRRYVGWEAWLVAAYGTGALFEWRDLRNTRESAARFSAFGEIEDLTSAVQLVAP